MYESPINLVFEAQQKAMQFVVQQQEDGIMAAVHSYGITVDKEELTRALRYDRGQYDKGYADGYADRDGEIVRCKDCKYRSSDDCPMYFEEDSVYTDDDGYREWDWTEYDNAYDDGFCDRGERRDDT